jgi:3-oxoacyl-[acyl-carrier protein] reductase
MTKKTNPVALVTGAGKRLGRHIAIGLAKDGFDVLLHFHKSSAGALEARESIRKLGRNAEAIRADLRNLSQLRALVKKAAATYGRIDLLVNNAAVFTDSPLSRTTERIWDETMDVNLKAMFFCSKFVAPLMMKQKSGRIINIASLGGIQAWGEHIPYSVSKAGVIMLTKILAKELAPFVMVNAIAPGVIDLGREEYPSQTHIARGRIPLQRFGQPEDIASLAVFLARKANYITGQTFPVDGGRSI